MSIAKHWVFTLNNYSAADLEKLRTAEYTYLVVGREKGESGTPHLQGYIAFGTKRRMPKKLLSRAHWEVMRGTPAQAAEYCKKEGDYEEYGQMPETGGEKEKRRWEEALSAAKRGKFEEVPADIAIRYHSNLRKIHAEHAPRPEPISKLEHQWIYGDTGVGKTTRAREENPKAYLKGANKWWCGYAGEEVVIIEEWSPDHHVLAHHLKQWADHWPFRAEVKGGSAEIRPRKIVITSNYSIDDCFQRQQDREPLKRRFCQIKITRD